VGAQRLPTDAPASGTRDGKVLYFCQTEMVNGIPVIQRAKPMLDSAMGSQLRTFGEIHGWLQYFAHQFRYGSGKILNECGKHSYSDALTGRAPDMILGWVSDKQRMLIMKHSDRHTFIDPITPRILTPIRFGPSVASTPTPS
jgi:Protein of unknown function (DUF3435)